MKGGPLLCWLYFSVSWQNQNMNTSNDNYVMSVIKALLATQAFVCGVVFKGSKEQDKSMLVGHWGQWKPGGMFVPILLSALLIS